MQKYEHGGNIEAFAKNNGYKIKDIIDLSSNINYLKPKITVDFNTLDISSYPTYERLYQKIAKHYKVKGKNIELFNGGSSAIFSLFKHLNLKECVIYSPAYLEYKKATKVHNYNLHIVNRFNNIEKKVPKNALVIFVNPSTPDGQLYELEKLLEYWKQQNCTVLIDESFLEFTTHTSATKLLKKYKNLYILKSMTKIFSAAGIRIGTLISTPKNIQKLQEKEPIWKLSTFDMYYLLNILEDKTFVQKTVAKSNENRKFLIAVLENYTFVNKIYESHANYLLIKLQKLTAQQLQSHLANYGIMIRDCSNFDGLNKYHVRIAVKSKKSIKLLQTALNILKC